MWISFSTEKEKDTPSFEFSGIVSGVGMGEHAREEENGKHS